jgi:branched-chain amino acid transport system permease protein
VVRPWGLLGRPDTHPRPPIGAILVPFRRLSAQGRYGAIATVLALAALPMFVGNYGLAVAAEILIFALFAMSLHLMMGVGGMVSFGHAAYFGLGAYGAALLARHFGAGMEIGLLLGPLLALAGAVVYGWFCVRLSGVYFAMLTLAFAQITWSIVFQWYEVTGGDNGILGIWPSRWAANPMVFFYLTLVVCMAGLVAIRRMIFSPFGYAVRACRDSTLRAEAIGMDQRSIQWLCFVIAGAFAGVSGALYAYLKGSVFPDALAIPTSIDGLVMVLLGGIHTVAGPIAGAAVYKFLSIYVMSQLDYWKLILGGLIVVLVVAFPQGIGGFFQRSIAPRLGRGEEDAEDVQGPIAESVADSGARA